MPGIGLVWDLVVTMTASWQKVFSDNPAIGYFAQRARYAEARDAGELLAPATDADQMDQIVFNSTLNGTLQATVRAAGDRGGGQRRWSVCVRALRAGGLPTTEVPAQPSYIVAPADFFATAEEKEAVRRWEESEPATAGGAWEERP